MSLQDYLSNRIKEMGVDEYVQFEEIVAPEGAFNPYSVIVCPECGGLVVPGETQQKGAIEGFWPEVAVCEDCGHEVGFVVFKLEYPIFEMKEEVARGQIVMTATDVVQYQTDIYVYVFKRGEDPEGGF